MNIHTRLACLFALFAGASLAQAVRVDPTPVMTTVGTVSPSGYPQLLAVPGAQVSVCASPANGVPCTNYATTYSDGTGSTACPTNAQIVLAGTNACVSAADNRGNFGFWVAPGSYTFTINSRAGVSGPYPLSAAPVSSSVIPIPATAAPLTYLRTNPNDPNRGYGFEALATLKASDYLFSQTPGGSISVGTNAVTLNPLPLGVVTGDTLYISGGAGTPEAVTVSSVSGSTVSFTAANTHSGAWSITTASGGIQEAVCASNGTEVEVTAVPTLEANVTTCGLANAKVRKMPGVVIPSTAFTILSYAVAANGNEETYETNAIQNVSTFDFGNAPEFSRNRINQDWLNPQISTVVGNVFGSGAPGIPLISLAAYARPTGTGDGVGLFSECEVGTNNGSCFGMNIVVGDNAGAYTNPGLGGLEIDQEGYSAPTSNSIGLAIVQYNVQNPSPAMIIRNGGGAVPSPAYAYGLYSDAGATNIALYANTQSFLSSSPSQLVEFRAGNGAIGTVGEDSVGNLILTGVSLGIPHGASNPGTCAVGNIFFNTASGPGANLFGCTSTNTWTAQAGGGGSGSPGGSSGQIQWNNGGAFAGFTMGGDAIVTPSTGVLVVHGVNSVSYPASPSLHATPVVTASNSVTYKIIPDCQDTSGQHLNYTQSTDLFSCGTSGGGGSGLNQLTGDVLAGPGTGSQVATLPTVNSNVGACGDATHVGQVTLNAKGLTTGCTPVAITGASNNVAIQQSGTPQGNASTLNCSTNLTCSLAGSVATITATAGSGGGPTSSLTDFFTTGTSSTASVAAGTFREGNVTYKLGASVFTVAAPTISTCTNASPIVCTLSSVSGLHNGDTVMITGVVGNTAANGTWTITLAGGSTIQLLGSTGSGTYTSGGVVAGSGSGFAYIEVTKDGNVEILHSSAAGMIFTCTGSCISNQIATPAFDTSAYPVAEIVITGGALGAVTDERGVASNVNVAAGDGTAVTASGGTYQVAVDSSVARTTGSQTYTGQNTNTGLWIDQPAGSLPSCTSSIRGARYFSNGGSTITSGADGLQVCRYNGSAYAWYSIF